MSQVGGPTVGGAGQVPSYAAPYRPPVDPRYAAVMQPRAVRHGPWLGRTALIVAIGALLVAAAPSWIAAQAAGQAAAIGQQATDGQWAWAHLQPVRDVVLLGETGFWVGVALGAWAVIQGIVAARTHRGRRSGVWAIAIAAVLPLFVAVIVFAAFTIGADTAAV